MIKERSRDFYLGLDVGGTKIEGAIAQLFSADQSIKVFAKKRISMSPSKSFEEFILSLVQLVNDLLAQANLSLNEVRAIGIGLPGSLDPKTKIMRNGNTRFLIGKDVIGALKNKLNFELPIVVQNDANLFVLAEAWGGVGKTYSARKQIGFKEQIALGVTLGTGVGGGLTLEGKIFNGAQGSGLEVGHISLNPNGPSCYCGQKGCAETYLSGTALNKLVDSKKLFENAKSGDPQALKILADYRQHLVHFLTILNNLFNPHYFVFGGGLSAQDDLFKDLKKDLEKNIFLGPQFCPDLMINQLGDGSGLFGAMIYAGECLDS